MMARPSIRSRLTRLLVGLALVWGLAVSAVVWLAVRHEVDELLDDTLRASAEVLAALLATVPPQAVQPPVGTPVAARFAWQVVGGDAQVLMRSARAPEQPWMPLPSDGFADAGHDWRVYGLRLPGGTHMLYVAQTGTERREAQREVALTAIGFTLAIGTVAALWLRWRVRREMVPLAELSEALARYEPLQPGAALPPAGSEELVAIHDAIEALGRRLAQRVANERAFSAHAAHALRTPLAGIDTQLAVALRECAPEQRPRLERVRQAAGRLTRVVSALLALFRSGVELQWQAVDLAALLARLPLEGLEIQVHADCPLKADPDLLTAALLNLLDNSVRHGAAHVHARLSTEGPVTVLRLEDDGRGVGGAQREALHAALAEQAYEGRMGLGLMLADLVARAHGGSLQLPPVARGFAVEMRLGAAPPVEAAAAQAPPVHAAR